MRDPCFGPQAGTAEEEGFRFWIGEGTLGPQETRGKLRALLKLFRLTQYPVCTAPVTFLGVVRHQGPRDSGFLLFFLRFWAVRDAVLDYCR